MPRSETKNKPVRTDNIISSSSPDTVLDDILQIELSNVSNTYKAKKEATDNQISLTQDIMSVSLTVLGGAITLKIFASQTVIKTPLLFYLASAGLLVCVVFSLIIRLVLTSTWRNVSELLAESEKDIRMTIGDVKYHDEEHHLQAMERFNELGSKPYVDDEPMLAKLKPMIGLVSLFIISLIAIALSLLFKISVS